jgi:hypothetical protein
MKITAEMAEHPDIKTCPFPSRIGQFRKEFNDIKTIIDHVKVAIALNIINKDRNHYIHAFAFYTHIMDEFIT